MHFSWEKGKPLPLRDNTETKPSGQKDSAVFLVDLTLSLFYEKKFKERPFKCLTENMEESVLEHKKPVGIAVIGTGAWSGAVGHVMLKSQKVKLVTCFDTVPEKRKAFSEK